MLQQQFIDSVRNPSLLNDSQINDLESIVREYPFFETAHLLYTKALKKQNSLNYAKQLRKAAIIVNSRIVLHDFLHQKEILKAVDVEQNLVSDNIKALDHIVIPVKNEIEEVISSSVTTTSNDVKVIYISTNTDENNKTKEFTKADDVAKIETEKHHENNLEQSQFDIDKLNKVIEQEISRGVIQSYVESDILKTPDLDKTEKNEPVSFTDWLHKIKKEAHTIQKTELVQPKNNVKSLETKLNIEEKPIKVKQNRDIIDKIIESDPGKLKLGTNKFFTPNLDAKQSLLENEHLVTETLAKIYALQGNTNKAIRAYEILSLKFPQKSVYFTTLIQNLKNNK